jgi:hypothetical protein
MEMNWRSLFLSLVLLTAFRSLSSADSFTAWDNVFDPTQGPSASFHYQFDRPGFYTIRIYTSQGQLVRQFPPVQGPGSAGSPLSWDGKNNDGVTVASGVYLARVTGPGFSKTRKVVVIK